MKGGPSEFSLRFILNICEYQAYVSLLRAKINEEDEDDDDINNNNNNNNNNNKSKVKKK
jgi:hypothetical protein